MSAHKYRVITYAHPKDFPMDVIKLFEIAESIDFESNADWYINFVDTVVPRMGKVLFYVLHYGETALVVMPLLLVQKTFHCELHSLSNFYTSLYAPVLNPIAKVEDVTYLIKNIIRRHRNLSLFRLVPMATDSQTTSMLSEAFKRNGFIKYNFFCFKNWYLIINQTWQEYISTRPGQVKNTIKRMSKRFEAAGGTFEIVTKGIDLNSTINDYEKIYKISWKRPEPYQDFVPGLIRMCADKGSLRLGIARINGNAVAAQIWVVNHECASIYKLAYDENFKSYSPGTLLTTKLMQYVFEVDKVNVVDYLTGDDAYKQAWMSDSRDRIGMVAYNPKTIIGLAGLTREVLGRWCKPWLTMLRRFGFGFYRRKHEQ